MNLVLTKDEVERIYIFTNNMKNPTANTIFNKIFGCESNKHVATKFRSDGMIEISLDPEISNDFLDILVKNGYSIGQLKDYSGICLLNRVKRLWDNTRSSFEKLAAKFES